MLDVMIVDDEGAGCRALREYCALEADLRVVGEYGDGRAALKAIRARTPHVIFLDIKMESMDGVALVRSLDQPMPPLIVFVTAYEHYAVEAFELSAVDYLLKPFGHARFRKALGRVRDRMQTETTCPGRDVLEELLERIEHARDARREARRRLLVGMGAHRHMLDAERIEVVCAHRNYVRLTVGSQTYPARSTLQQMEIALQTQQMLRVSRSCLVNMDHVREISRTPRGDFILVLAGGTTVTSSEGFRDAVRRHVDRFKVAPE